jgi:hypothetical protein
MVTEGTLSSICWTLNIGNFHGYWMQWSILRQSDYVSGVAIWRFGGCLCLLTWLITRKHFFAWRIMLTIFNLNMCHKGYCLYRQWWHWQETKLKRAVPLHAMKALGGRHYSSYTFSISALDGCEWSASRPDRALAPGKEPSVPTVQEDGWAPEPVWTQRLQEKSSCLCGGSNLDRPVVQPVARHYTDWATRLTQYTKTVG